LLAAAEVVNPPLAAAAVLAGCYRIAVRHLRREPFSLLLWARAALLVCLEVLRLRRGQTLLLLGIPQLLAVVMAEVTASPLALVVMAAQAAAAAVLLPALLVALGQAAKVMLVAL
jgi:hypothetical protein